MFEFLSIEQTPQSISSSVLRSYMPIGHTASLIDSPKTPPEFKSSTRIPSVGSYQTLSSKTQPPIKNVALGSPSAESHSPLAERGDEEEEEEKEGDLPSLKASSTLPRKVLREQPLVDRVASPGSLGSSGLARQYYTLKINCTRRHNESFV